MPAVDVDARPEAGPLGKHEELSTRPGIECTCRPKFLRLRNELGELVQPRGGLVNRCEKCAQLAAVENCEMLVLDALAGGAPTLVAILGTATVTLDMAEFERGRQEVVRAVRRRWPEAQYAYQVEYTTGYGPRSRGQRRPHWNWFWKGIPREDWTAASFYIVRAWCRYVDAAEPQAQYVDVIRNEVGLTKYVTEHFMKASQRPPAGFSGQRFCCSRGYFGEGVSVKTARKRARESLIGKRALWHARRAGFDAYDAELLAYEAKRASAERVWVLTNDRGARLSGPVHDARRMALVKDREAGERVRAGILGVPEVARPSGVEAGRAQRAAKRRRMEARTAAVVRTARQDGELRLFPVWMHGVRATE